MKLAVPALLLLLLPTACKSKPDVEPVRPATAGVAELDFSPYSTHAMTLEEFLQVCQKVSGYSFTYAQSTKEALAASSLRLRDPERVPVADFESFLAAQLQGPGFTCKRVGPEHLRVYLIERKA